MFSHLFSLTLFYADVGCQTPQRILCDVFVHYSGVKHFQPAWHKCVLPNRKHVLPFLLIRHLFSLTLFYADVSCHTPQMKCLLVSHSSPDKTLAHFWPVWHKCVLPIRLSAATSPDKTLAKFNPIRHWCRLSHISNEMCAVLELFPC